MNLYSYVLSRYISKEDDPQASTEAPPFWRFSLNPARNWGAVSPPIPLPLSLAHARNHFYYRTIMLLFQNFFPSLWCQLF